MLVVADFDLAQSLEGRDLGVSGWRRITQDEVDQFGQLVDDTAWMHCDPKRASSGPYGGTIVHGLLTLAHIPSMLDSLFRIDLRGTTVNYGLDRVRYPAACPVGSEIRLLAIIAGVEAEADRYVHFRIACKVEVRGQERPVMVADFLIRHLVGNL